MEKIGKLLPFLTIKNHLDRTKSKESSTQEAEYNVNEMKEVQILAL
jgi:hypothetical protein